MSKDVRKELRELRGDFEAADQAHEDVTEQLGLEHDQLAAEVNEVKASLARQAKSCFLDGKNRDEHIAKLESTALAAVGRIEEVHGDVGGFATAVRTLIEFTVDALRSVWSYHADVKQILELHDERLNDQDGHLTRVDASIENLVASVNYLEREAEQNADREAVRKRREEREDQARFDSMIGSIDRALNGRKVPAGEA
jgi:chromosome segregation ATPase